MRNGVFPTRKALLFFLLPLVLIGFAFFDSLFLYLGFALDILLVLIILFDLFFSPNYKKNVPVEIRFPATFTINSLNSFTAVLHNNNRLPVRLRILLDFDMSFDRAYAKNILFAGPLESREYSLRVFARRRGKFTSTMLYIKGRSWLGFLAFHRRMKQENTVAVPPFIDPVNQVFKMTQRKIKQCEGMQRSAFLGNGRDFEMLRAYSKGDDFNKIDWKASARIRKPVTRVYRLENSMETALLVDCGRIMATEVSGMSLLDYAVNAALILAYAAVRNYDSASLLCFGSTVTSYIPPIKNKKDIRKLDLVLSQVPYEHVESDYQSALSFASQKLSKRSVIILFTDIIDDSNINIFHRYLSVMRRRHIVILVLIRDKNLFHTGEAAADKQVSIFMKAAAADLILRRNRTIHDLRRLGIDILDVYPEEVSVRLLNRYLELKSRN